MLVFYNCQVWHTRPLRDGLHRSQCVHSPLLLLLLLDVLLELALVLVKVRMVGSHTYQGEGTVSPHKLSHGGSYTTCFLCHTDSSLDTEQQFSKPHLILQSYVTYQHTLEAAIRAVKIPGTISHIRGKHLKIFFVTEVVTMLIIVHTVAVLRITARPAHALNLR